MTKEQRPYIVAEISKNWPQEQGLLLSEMFENVINTNVERGYVLYSWQVQRHSPQPGQMNETIIAVFQKREVAEDLLRLIVKEE